MPITLVLGGARSGKSSFAQKAAEELAAVTGAPLVFVATAEAKDAEMAERIARHQRARSPSWFTIEAPLELAASLDTRAPGEVVVVDCLTLWLSNLLLGQRDTEVETRALIGALRRTQSHIWLVSNEVGSGIVPEHALARRFRDEAGRLHQELAAAADRVFLMVAGLSLPLK
jgi:adenosylcobinamide kinase/adenosylcobinamide-phosphate guanylyltransferase